ncbi:MAG: hypothetical protein ACI8QT_000001 [Halioglobus sp.]|jgi:hypothetical protein
MVASIGPDQSAIRCTAVSLHALEYLDRLEP